MSETKKRVLIFADESSQTQARYTILSGVIFPETNLPLINQTFNAFRYDRNMLAELKWEKVSNQKFNEYKEFVDLFFALNESNKLFYRALIIDNYAVDHRRFNVGDKELGFFKFYYQFLLHSFGRFNWNRDLFVYLDEKTTSQSLDEFRNILNRGMRARYKKDTDPFKLIEFRDSHEHNVLQVVDVIMGGIAHRKNQLHLVANARKAKIDLGNYIRTRARLTEQIGTTPVGERNFCVWNFRTR